MRLLDHEEPPHQWLVVYMLRLPGGLLGGLPHPVHGTFEPRSGASRTRTTCTLANNIRPSGEKVTEDTEGPAELAEANQPGFRAAKGLAREGADAECGRVHHTKETR